MKKIAILFIFLLTLVGFPLSAQNAVLVENNKVTVPNLGGNNYTLGTNAELRISNPITANGTINFTSDSAWVILDGILPSVAIASHIGYINVNGQPAVNNVNIKVTNYLRGCVIMPHTPDFKALTVYKDVNYSGEEMKFQSYTYYKTAQLGSFDNTISSFKLKKGYMATFAQNENGTGYSKVFIAEKEDILISTLQIGLNDKVSFIRVFPWRYTDKKGFASGLPDFNRTNIPVKLTNSGWFYHWGTNSAEDLTDVEFVSMKWNAKSLTDSRWQEILDINYSSHLLGFNEPDAATQGNMTIDEMILYWPKMLESGMRLGSPAVAGTLPLLYEFIDKCDELNYRVDFVAMHDYGEGTALAFYNKCKAVHDRTGRPIWIKEFNSGGTWTRSTPTYPEISARIGEIMEKYDTEGIIERYSIFNFDETVNDFGGVQNRAIFYTPAIPTYTFTPLGIVYRDNVSPMAFNAVEEINIPLKLVAPQKLTGSNKDGITTQLLWDNLNTGDLNTVLVERSFNSGPFVQAALLVGNVSSFEENVAAIGLGQYYYRLSILNPNMTTTKYTNLIVNVNPNERFNVALNKSAFTNSIHSAPYPASKAVDGNNVLDTSRWLSLQSDIGLPPYIEINFGDFYLINELRLYSGYQAYNTPLTSFTFQYWNVDRWEDLVTETTNTISAYSKSFAQVKTNKVRLSVIATPGSIVKLYEIEVYGTFSSTLGVNDYLVNKFSMYPNPVSNLLNISGGDTVESLEISDVNGRQLIKKEGVNSVDISKLSKGIYFIKLNNKETIKFIKN